MSKLRPALQRLVDLLDDLPLDDDLVRDEMKSMNMDVDAWAAEVSAREAAAAAQERTAVFEAADSAYRDELSRFEARPVRPRLDKNAQLALLRKIVAKAPAGVAMHFHKFESASEEELAAVIDKLRYLLDDDESE